jgi:hypothetical protein
MFNTIEELMKALQAGGGPQITPGAMGGSMPSMGFDGQAPMPPAMPMTPAQQAAPMQGPPVPPASFSNPSGPTAPGLTGPFPTAPGLDPTQTASIPSNAGQFAGMGNLNGPSQPGLTGQFPDAPGMKGILGGIGRAIGTNDGTAGPTAFGGLLKFKDDDSKQAAMEGLLSASMNLAASGGPSDTPNNGIGAIAPAVGIGYYNGYKGHYEDKARLGKVQAENAKEAYAIEQAKKNAQIRQNMYGGGASFNGGSNAGATAAQNPASASPSAGSDTAAQLNAERRQAEAEYNGLMLMGDNESARPIRAQMYALDNEAYKMGRKWNGQQFVQIPGWDSGKAQEAYAEGSGRQAGTESQIRTDDQRNFEYGQTHPDFLTPQQKQAAADARKVDQDAFKDEQDLRKEYLASPVYKRWDTVRASYDRIQSGAAQDNGAGDLGMIYGYMKALDPGSVVREGEFATAEQAAGVPTQVLNLYNKIVNGERLTPEQRQQFLSASQDLYVKEAGKLEELNTQYSGIAGAHHFEPSRIIIKPKVYEPIKLPTAAPGAPGAAAIAPEWKPRSAQPVSPSAVPQVGEVRRGFKFMGGNPADPTTWQKAN